MDQLLQYVLYPAILITLALSVFFSFRSRRAAGMRAKGMHTARLNISMGFLLIFIALVQLFLSEDSTLRIVIGGIFIAIGVFNLFAGLRNLSVYRSMKQTSEG
ncbi:YtpI family protein [Paenibacillus sp. PL2-23]|uniref:YtpI family protein n=1 Tax=Paenibacillus sp. PL2-23 TaxID=2100729 RepID=UPI0030FB7172